MALFRKKSTLPARDEALPGRSTPLNVPPTHFVNGHRIVPPFPAGMREAVFALGCFWGAERLFWELPGVYSTAVGYAGGFTPNPTYQEVCTGETGHTEVVKVIYDPAKTDYEDLLKVFWESHEPTQGMRQGNEGGTQYRSAIYETGCRAARCGGRGIKGSIRRLYGRRHNTIRPRSVMRRSSFAEDYHQRYLAKESGRVLRDWRVRGLL
jgi:peptide-methionine (S)-S-oxide reductase